MAPPPPLLAALTRLGSSQRVPYLVFAEVILMEKPAPPVWSARKEFAAAAGRVVDAAADRSEFVASVQESMHAP